MPVVREADPSLEGKQIDKDGRSQGRDAGRYSGADIIWAVGLKVQGKRERHSSGLADQEQAASTCRGVTSVALCTAFVRAGGGFCSEDRLMRYLYPQGSTRPPQTELPWFPKVKS